MMPNEQIILQKEIDTQQLFDTSSKIEYQNSIQKTVEYVLGFLENDKFYSGASVKELKDKKGLISATKGETLTLDQALKEIKELYLDHAIVFHNTSYVAHLNCPVLIPALVGELIANAVNTAIETWDQSTSATLIEQEMINWICGEFKLPKSSDGVFTNGGTQSNFMALLMARDHYAYQNYGINIKENGFTDIVSKFRFFCSDKSHFSIQKNAALLGMGYQSVIKVQTDANYKMDTEALLLAIEKEKQLGNIPIAVVATTGTTDFGSFDPVETISKIAKDYNMWLHVDGAYGGCFVLTNTHKHLLEGVKYADSVTIDFHKTLFQPVSSSAFLVGDKSNFKYVSHYADYLNPVETKDDEYQNLIVKSIQTTRRFDALKLWFTLKMTGTKILAEYLETVHYRAKEVYALLKKDTSFETVHNPELSTIVFRYKAEGITDNKIHDTINLYIKNCLFKSGEASVASTKLNGNIHLKFTLLNPKITTENLQHIIMLMKRRGNEYLTSN
jgi:L-2,4-diaminobutyrate decarboxylase